MLDRLCVGWQTLDMTTKQIAYVKHLATGHYGDILDAGIDGSIAIDTHEGRIARMILSILDGNTRYADRIKNSTVSDMIALLKSFDQTPVA